MTFNDKKKVLNLIITESECDELLIKFLARHYHIDLDEQKKNILGGNGRNVYKESVHDDLEDIVTPVKTPGDDTDDNDEKSEDESVNEVSDDEGDNVSEISDDEGESVNEVSDNDNEDSDDEDKDDTVDEISDIEDNDEEDPISELSDISVNDSDDEDPVSDIEFDTGSIDISDIESD